MTTNRQLDEILAEIGREHRAIRGPERLKAELFTAAGKRKDGLGTARLTLIWTSAAVVMLLAVVATAGVISQIRRSHQPQNQQVRSVAVPPVGPEPMLSSARATERQNVAAKSAPVHRARSGRASLRDSSPRRSWNSLDEFVPLPVSEGLPPADELSVVRIKLRGSDLQQYGLEAPADAVAQTMLAEFVVGEDGLPRAIRIVR